MMEDRSPEIGKAAFVCPHCKAHALQNWFDLGATPSRHPPYAYDPAKIAAVIEEEEAKKNNDVDGVDKTGVFKRFLEVAEREEPGISDDDTIYTHPIINCHISVCFACTRETLWIGARIVYPSRTSDAPEPNVDLPVDIRRDYEEAAAVLAQSPRSAAALLRLAIQKLCSHLLGEAGDTNAMIGTLVQRGLSPTIQQALDVVRVVGNEAVHPGTLDLRDDTTTVSRLFVLVNLISEAMISHPKHVAELYGLIPENKLQGIAARDRPKQPALAAPSPSGGSTAGETGE